MKKINLKNTTWVTAAIIAFVMLSADVMAQKGQRDMQKPGMGQGMMQNQANWEPGQRCLKMLDLTTEQEEQMKTLRVKHLEQMLPFRNAMQEKRARLQTLRTAKNVDMKAINNLIDEMADLKADQMKAREAHRQEMRNILTDEQRVIFDSFKGMKKCARKGDGKGFRGDAPGHGMGR